MSSGSDSLDDSDSDLSNGPDNELILQYLNDFEPHRYPSGAALVPDRTDRIWHNTYTERTRHSFSGSASNHPSYSADGSRISSLTTTASQDSTTRWQEPRPRHVPGQQRYYMPTSRMVGPEPRAWSPLLPAVPQRELRPPHRHWHEGSAPSPRPRHDRALLPSPLSREAGKGGETAVVLSGGARPACGSTDALPGPERTEHADATSSSEWPLVKYQQPRDSGIEVEEQKPGGSKIENTPAQWFSSAIKTPKRVGSPDLKRTPWSWEALPGVEQDVQGSPKDLRGETASSSTVKAPEGAEPPHLKPTPWSWEAVPGIEQEHGESRQPQQSGAPLLAIEGPGLDNVESDALVIFSGPSLLRRQPAQKRSLVMRSFGGKFGIGRGRGA
ncbi:hypothetical protein LTR35_011053 [Friedmanniomyces endolithicus]|uniref:Uncharacterized protein n=1 Tax=Friedmanniomyces endolithicus TaxID=329885 RepID=A0AAN6FT73_9PEZI|nr:hypothetical protein LTR35_011053 [Friedmanniomyces endolithicus]KAK0299629.1 hypothetical protein LTS00_002074 [Friedmanniomyces endolithicus]KAK0323680.1 hypothetical protein LTR82_005427 [Friedmanniomyces endolithicus]KAK1019042.1 hypothetical protein LTR54_000855 [Friedmanniomyces endolithicus]